MLKKFQDIKRERPGRDTRAWLTDKIGTYFLKMCPYFMWQNHNCSVILPPLVKRGSPVVVE
ncbi:MAG: hypothetical protein AVO34_04620 [Firmicutes bacterium ML8_F2]|nr:MAG: hypothetical protein AVO34_04620 [Firmicutes bacterium ML8_F2]